MFWLGFASGIAVSLIVWPIIAGFCQCVLMARGAGRRFSFKAFLRHGISVESFPSESRSYLAKKAKNNQREYAVKSSSVYGNSIEVTATHRDHVLAGRVVD